MKITPIDITNKEFKRTMRGYSTEEVDEFLDEIVEDFEALYRENANLKEKIDGFNEKISHYASIENTIQSTLILAQNTADSTKQQALNEAEAIIRGANERSNMILDKAADDVELLKREYEKYRQEFASYRRKVRQFMEDQMDNFNMLTEELEKTPKTPLLKVAPPREDNAIGEEAAQG